MDDYSFPTWCITMFLEMIYAHHFDFMFHLYNMQSKFYSTFVTIII